MRSEKGIPAGLQSNWEPWRQASEHLGVLAINLEAPATYLGARQITVEQSGKNTIFFGNTAGVPGNHTYYFSFNDF